MVLGTFAALNQRNVQRLLAYSSIVHSGFLLALMSSPTTSSLSSFLFYIIIYALANYAIFYINQQLIHKNRISEISQYTQLNTKNITVMIALVFSMVSLVGIPPLAGFTSKLLLFSSLWESFQVSNNLFVLSAFLIGLLTAIVGLFYYMKLPYHVFIKKGNHSEQLFLSPKEIAVLTLYVIPLLIFFVQPQWLLELISHI